MKYMRLLMVFSLSFFAISAFADHYKLYNGSAYSLVYTEKKDGGQCGTPDSYPNVTSGDTLNFNVDTDTYKCVWTYAGFKIMDGSKYMGFLSLNVSYRGGLGRFIYYSSIKYSNGDSCDTPDADDNNWLLFNYRCDRGQIIHHQG